MQEVQTPSQNPTQTQEPTLALAHSLLENSQTLLRQLRNLLQQLRPAGLEGDHDQTRALQRAIESLADQWRQRLAGQTDIVVNLQLPAANLPSRLSLACYRIVQEALTNAARHAQASRIDLTIRHELGDAGLFVEIRDNGIGRIDQTETPHAGPRSLQERAHGQAGRLTLLQNQPSGWIVQLTLPMYE
jgi:two-component system sensor histidine kinase UhpB